jgi:Trk K+ transport system NAD-binding subunit
VARVIVIGGHGKVALQLARILTDRGDEVAASLKNMVAAAQEVRAGA